MSTGGIPTTGGGYDFGQEDRDIHQALLAMADTLTTVKEYLNYFVNNLWENMIHEDFIHLKTDALDALGSQEISESAPRKWTINWVLNKIIEACRQPQRLLDSSVGHIVRERIVANYLNADILNFENKVLLGPLDWIKKLDPRKWPFKKMLEIVLKGLNAANTILDSLKKVWSQLEVVEELKKHLENLVA